MRTGQLLRIAREEYKRLAAKRSFVLALIGMPLFIGAIAAIAIVTGISGAQSDTRAIGYVDLAGVTATALPAAYEPPEDITVQRFDDEAAARAALESGAVQGYYLLPQDYLANRSVQLYTWGESPSGRARGAFQDLLEAHLVAQAPAANQAALLGDFDLYYRTTTGGRSTPIGGLIVAMLFPFLIGFFFLMVIMSSGGYLLQAVATEKENRMVEVMMTTVSPFTLIGGKALGLIGVALTQIGVWLAALVVAVVIAARNVPELQGMTIPWTTIGLTALYFLPTYVLLSGLMIAVGSLVPDVQHGQQISGFFNLLFAVPFFFFILIFTTPDSPLMVLLTLFPTTAMLTVAMRAGVTAVPAWQVISSFVIATAAAIASVWFASRVFRIGMLQYGQPVSLASLRSLLRPARSQQPAKAPGPQAS